MKRTLVFGILFCLLIVSVSAELYTWKVENTNQIISQEPIWSDTLETESGKIINVSLVNLSAASYGASR